MDITLTSTGKETGRDEEIFLDPWGREVVVSSLEDHNDLMKQLYGDNVPKVGACPKCGCAKHTIEYIPDVVQRAETYSGCAAEQGIEENDYIEATCDRCGYSWRVEPLNKEKR